ncbi:hypothetical protein GGS21DRAFT_416062 [Xylaria nigripes]|nr:hypothetical protein GGS21DRAFT_416062 [Xylaria nigripes]
MATDPAREAALARAIEIADDKTLRLILKSMCKESEACREEAMKRMLVSRKHEIIELSDSSDDEEEKNRQGKKQKVVEEKPASRFAKCETCDATYDVTLNDDEACQTHDDILEIEPEYFPDDDQVEYEPHTIDVETDYRRKICPEGFRWQCCDVDINGRPCVIQRHIPRNV